MNETIFRIILPVLLLSFMAHRGYYNKMHTRPDVESLQQREEGVVSKLADLLGMVGLASVVVFIINPGWLVWAKLPFPGWIRMAGIAISLIGFILRPLAQNALGSSWSDTPRMLEGQTLITSGPYRRIRHPIYTAFLLILGSTLFISANWLIGLSWTFMTLLEISSRIRFEENLMSEYFSDQYREYIRRTCRLFPKLV